MPEEQLRYYLAYSWWDKRIHAFPKGICQKVNVIALLEFELTYYNVAAQHVNNYAMGTLSSIIINIFKKIKWLHENTH